MASPTRSALSTSFCSSCSVMHITPWSRVFRAVCVCVGGQGGDGSGREVGIASAVPLLHTQQCAVTRVWEACCLRR